MRAIRAAVATTIGLALMLTPPTAAQADSTDHPADAQTSVERGVIRSTAEYVPGRTAATVPPSMLGPDLTPQHGEQAANSMATPEDEAFKAECESQDAALDEAGWFRDRYSQCARRNWIITIFVNNVPTGTVTSEITMLGFGSNGNREVRYVVFVDDIRKTNAPTLVLDTMFIRVSFLGCNAALVACPTIPSRDAAVAAWRLQEDWSITFASPDISGGGPQIVPQTLHLNLYAHSPAQPEFSWSPSIDTSVSRTRYDSADYVGASRGAVFTDYRLVFEVDVNDPTQDESALHILQAQEHPMLTFPSWVGKTVPGKTTPLTRMHNKANNDANRNKSVAMCKSIWGEYDGLIQNCDEYPFASTYEGSYTGAPTSADLQRYSVRVIDAADNQHVGRDLLENGFYKANRVLNGDQFFVKVNT
ncbi:hypothetical protein KBX50_25735 [Micromonospora sp. C51]|uniref:NucA/NucB deoxyribonuclease domain-containing protein n=1 Tax=Micromonospora sp. C51 TaxID=2824879 RepID=UPI001B38B99A|nr:NucA/NucB deoxyribonuclease domain-containing protein [Micromonospora sp. C51]MBQ1051851.1 hypothetical protein [Micromonospora sp. C51]